MLFVFIFKLPNKFIFEPFKFIISEFKFNILEYDYISLPDIPKYPIDADDIYKLPYNNFSNV